MERETRHRLSLLPLSALVNELRDARSAAIVLDEILVRSQTEALPLLLGFLNDSQGPIESRYTLASELSRRRLSGFESVDVWRVDLCGGRGAIAAMKERLTNPWLVDASPWGVFWSPMPSHGHLAVAFVCDASSLGIAGVQPGDELVAIDGDQSIYRSRGADIVETINGSDKVSLEFVRDGMTVGVHVVR